MARIFFTAAATDDRLRTWIDTPAGSFPFQEWFVGRGHRDDVDGVRFEGSDAAAPAPGTLEALAGALLGMLDTGDEVVVFEPMYDSDQACIALAGARPQPRDAHPVHVVSDPCQQPR